MVTTYDPALWILSGVLLAASLGVILAKKPVYAALSFLLTLITLAAIYLQLSAEFIAAMQVLVYAGAILVIFMFVIILFQDAHDELERYKAVNRSALLAIAGIGAFVGLALLERPDDRPLTSPFDTSKRVWIRASL